MRHAQTAKSWNEMRQRCKNPNNDKFKHYGGRGISVCERWEIYDNFLADMGERPFGKTLDRIDVNGNYEPGNCRWASPHEQASNKRNNRIVVVDGQRIHLSELARRCGLKLATLWRRLDAGWTVEQAIKTPLLQNGHQGPNARKVSRKLNEEAVKDIINSKDIDRVLAEKHGVSRSLIWLVRSQEASNRAEGKATQ